AFFTMITALVGSSLLQAVEKAAITAITSARVSMRRNVEVRIGLLLAALKNDRRMSNVMKNMEYGASGRHRWTTFLSAFLLPLLLLAQPRPDQRRAQVEISTELGTIVIELYNQTPEHRDNFIKLVQEGHYDSLLFHRVVPGLVIQGGDPRSRNADPKDEKELGD